MGAFEPFRCSPWRGEVEAGLIPEHALAAEVERLADPGAARETLHWGRTYLYTARLATRSGAREVVVKQFRNQGWRAASERRRRGSRAERSWRAAAALAEAGIPTARPLLLIESEEREGPSYYVTDRVRDFLESRYYFRALAAGRAEEGYPEIDRAGLMAEIGRTFARLHDGGVWHRDLSIGNLLIRARPGGGAPELVLIDLDRCRLGRPPGTSRRLRDICRLPILTEGDRRHFWRGYWGEGAELASLQGLAYRSLQWGFLAKNRWKPRVRRPIRALRDLFVPRKAYAHIPAAPEDAGIRDKAVWDQLSDQPHQHAGRFERATIRLADAPAHTAAALAAAAAGPRIWRRYRALSAETQKGRRPWAGAGVAVRPLDGREQELLAALDGLGLRYVLIRLHPWQREHDAEESLARALHERGYELVFGLPQNRELVRDPDRWRRALVELAARFTPFGRHFQVGQAINRSKWGVWNYREYLGLAAAAREVFSAYEETKLLGPAVIDFEYQATAAVLNMKRPGAYFDIVSALLYVDRRGAPENRQLGFDTLGKCALLKAVAETARNAGGRCWITEVNWPLWEGPHSPAGRSVAVDEQTQADYLARYYLAALTSGHVERVYWWQLASRGYGLVDPGDRDLRLRPAYHALATLERELGGATFAGSRQPTPSSRLLAFEVDGTDRAVAWSLRGSERVCLGRPVERAVSAGGGRPGAASGSEVELTASPVVVDLG